MSYVGRATSTGSRGGVFISYARGDGEEFAGRLRERLEAEGVRLWQDRVAMEGGRDWWLQITEALDRVEFMVLLMTPNALRSETVRKEWRYARQQGVCVYPVKGSEGLDFDSLPRWMRDVHFYDLGRLEKGGAAGPEWKKFVNDLNTRCQARRVPFMVEDMPEDFVERPGEFAQLLSHLLNQREEPVAITAALRGAGGYGKTTLARALCHDERVQDAFDDGVLWVTLGETPGDLTGRVEDLIYTLSDERPGFTGIDAATAHLAELLADRDILVVVDDVWNGEHLRPFMQGGPRCARLVTTRNADTLPANARNVDVDAMRQDEAVALLGSGLPEGEEAGLRELAKRLGEWPLLLKLVNGTLRERVNLSGQRLTDAVAYVNKALDKKGLTFFDARNPVARTQAVSMTLGVSLEQLDEGERARYGELAVFPEDADVPLRTLEKFWGLTGGLDAFDAETLCERLARLSLLLRFDLATNRIRLHDVVRSFLMHKQGASLPTLHRRLLDAHRPGANTQDAPTHWADMPAPEPYMWDNLAYHLTEAGLGDELVSTVKDLRYLAAKTFLRKSLPVENDLLAAEAHAPDDKPLQLLRRSFVQSGHLLNRCDTPDDLKANLYCRLRHLEGLSVLTRGFARTLTRPYLLPVHPLPDLPGSALVRTLSGHRDSVLGATFSPDGSFVVSASRDRTLRVWDVRTGQERLVLEGHADVVNSCAVSPDGSLIVSASDDNTLKVWDAKSGAELFTLAGNTDHMKDCAFGPDGSFIVSAAWDGTLKVWDSATGRELRTLTTYGDSILSCAVSPDGSFVVTTSAEKTLKVWDMAGGGERFTLAGHGQWVWDCAVSPDNSFVVSASEDKTLKVWGAENGGVLHTLEGHRGGVMGCAVSPDGSFIVSASADGTLKLWSMSDWSERLTLIGHTDTVLACAVSPDGSLIASASVDATLKVWDVEGWDKGGVAGPRPSRLRGEMCCTVSPDGALVVSGSTGTLLAAWDATLGEPFLVFKGHEGSVRDCAFSPDGSFVVSASSDHTLRVWDAESAETLLVLEGHESFVNGCAVSPDGSFIVSASWDHTLKVWDARRGVELRTLEGHAVPVGGCAVSPDGTFVVSVGADGGLKVWDTEDWNARLTLRAHEAFVYACAVSADNSFVVSASDDGALKVWDAKTGDLRLTLSGHGQDVLGCAVSPDDSLIASTSLDKSLKVWCAKSGRCLSTFHTEGALSGCAWFPDGRRITAAGGGGIYFLRLVV